MPQQMYAQPGAPMYYAPGIPPRNFMYPQQQMMQQQRRWQPGNPSNPPQMVMGAMPGARPPNYQLMPVPAQQVQQGGNRPGGRSGKSNRMGGHGPPYSPLPYAIE